ncbi:MAG: serine hydrolase [Gammaproteobacteria bacterium]|nr:serine hydrolase [Gammaproteobacteria bacterium]
MIEDTLANEIAMRVLNRYIRSAVLGLQYIVVTADKALIEYAGGWADIQGQEAMTLDTTKMAYSITKIFTDIAIL